MGKAPQSAKTSNLHTTDNCKDEGYLPRVANLQIFRIKLLVYILILTKLN